MIKPHALNQYIVSLAKKRYSGRRYFMLRVLCASPETLPAGPTMKGKETLDGCILANGIPASRFAPPRLPKNPAV